jgi:alkylation response protein AidB-like acyl-CoA dehydrogenase
MTKLDLPEVPDDMAARLARLAHDRGVDVAQQALECFAHGLTEAEEAERELRDLREFRRGLGDVWVDPALIRRARNEGRP